MSASNGVETPRQKMIGMMYLVLTAMLALNVSSEVLDAFAIVDRGLHRTNQTAKLKNNEIIASLEKANEDNPVKVGPFLKSAKFVATETQKLIAEIQKDKVDIVKHQDGEDYNLQDIQNKGNRESAALVMLASGRAKALRERVHDYRDKLLNLLDKAPATLKKTIEKNLTLSDIKKKNRSIPWENATFEEMPMISSVTLLSQLQGNVRNAETDVLNHLSSQVDANSYKVTDVIASITGPTNTITGTNVTFQIFPTAIDATQELEGVVNGKKFKLVEGQYEYTFPANSVGTKVISGYLNILGPSGEIEKKQFKTELQVSSPSAVVSPSAMNVFYSGIKNPITVTAAGVQQSDIQIKVSGGKVARTSKGYNITPTVKSGSRVKITTIVKGRNMGTSIFRVKRVPTPTPMVGSKRGGRISKAELQANGGVDAILENFPFDGLKYKITGFTMTTTGKGGFSSEQSSNNDRFTSRQLTVISSLKRGRRVIIDQIVAVGPDGKSRALPALVFKIK